jgi:hypothetical protein
MLEKVERGWGRFCDWLKGAGPLTALQLGPSNVDDLAPRSCLSFGIGIRRCFHPI